MGRAHQEAALLGALLGGVGPLWGPQQSGSPALLIDLPQRHPAGRGGSQGAGLGPSEARVLLCWFVLELMSLIISLYILNPTFFMPCFSASVTGGANYLCDINS